LAVGQGVVRGLGRGGVKARPGHRVAAHPALLEVAGEAFRVVRLGLIGSGRGELRRWHTHRCHRPLPPGAGTRLRGAPAVFVVHPPSSWCTRPSAVVHMPVDV